VKAMGSIFYNLHFGINHQGLCGVHNAMYVDILWQDVSVADNNWFPAVHNAGH